MGLRELCPLPSPDIVVHEIAFSTAFLHKSLHCTISTSGYCRYTVVNFKSLPLSVLIL